MQPGGRVSGRYIVLVNGISMLEAYLENIPPGAMEIIEKAEKPTTIIYPGAQNLAENLLAPDGSIGIRICYDPFCRQLIDAAGIPIVSTSANFSGRDAPATFHEIDHSLRKQVDYVVNWRQEEQTATSPSSIIKLDDEGIVTVLRP